MRASYTIKRCVPAAVEGHRRRAQDPLAPDAGGRPQAGDHRRLPAVDQTVRGSLRTLADRDVQAEHGKAWVGELRKRISATSAGLALRSVKVMFAWGVEEKIIGQNHLANVRSPERGTQEREVWEDPAQPRQFLAFVKDDPKGKRDYPVIRLGFVTAMRMGELLGLRVEDVTDLNDDQIQVSVRQTRGTASGRVVTGAPKSKTSRRTLVCDETTTQVIRDWLQTRAWEKDYAEAWQESGLLFTDERSNGLSPQAFRRRFTDLVKRSGLPRITVHDMRHVGAIMMMSSARSPQDVKNISADLGHSSVAFTLDRYGHALDDAAGDRARHRAALIDGDDKGD